VVITRPQNLVHQIAIAGQENQTLGILVQPTNGENPLAVANMVDDVPALRRVRGADHTHWFVQGNKYQVLLVSRLDFLAVDRDRVTGQHLIAHMGCFPVNGHIAILDVPVRLTPGAKATFADVFVEAGRRLAGHGLPVRA